MGKICRIALLLVVALPACSLVGGAGHPSVDAGRQRSLEYGMLALESGDYREAAERLAPVAAICPVDELGRRAMLLLATAELDGRNPDGRPDAAAELAAFQLSRGAGEWEGALAAELYTIALDFGAEPIAAEDVPDAAVLWARYLSEIEVGMDADAPIGVDTDDAPPAAGEALAPDVEADAAARQVDVIAERGPRCDVPAAPDDLVMPVLEGTPIAHQRAPAPAQPSQEPAALPEDVRALQAEVQRLRGELASREQELDRIRRTLRP